MEFERTAIELFGLTLQEPMTALTDLLVSAVCFYAFWSLRSTHRSLSYLRLYFVTMAIATAYGGIIGHAFLDYLSFGWKVPGWIISMFSVALLERTAIAHAKPLLHKRTGDFFMILNGVELVALLIIVLTTLEFRFVESHAAYGLLVVVFGFEAYTFKITRAESSRYFLIAVGISAVAALVHLSEFTLHRWFNHLDLSHVLMAAAGYVFLIAGRKLPLSPSFQPQGGITSSRISSGTVTIIKYPQTASAQDPFHQRKRYTSRGPVKREVAQH
jgi:hypothetical protein